MTAGQSGEGGSVRKLLRETIKAVFIAGLTLAVIYFGWGFSSTGASAETPAAKAPAVDKIEVVALDPFVVNVTAPGSSAAAYLRVSVAIAMHDATRAADVRRDEALRTKLRAALLDELSSQTVPAVVSTAGRAELVNRLQARAITALRSQSLEVLITDFVAEY
jgi:flagellar basal body-associated protein FliL